MGKYRDLNIFPVLDHWPGMEMSRLSLNEFEIEFEYGFRISIERPNFNLYSRYPKMVGDFDRSGSDAENLTTIK